MTTLAVLFPNGCGYLNFTAQQRIDQGRFTNTRRPQQGDGLAGTAPRIQPCHVLGVKRINRQTRYVWKSLGQGCGVFGCIRCQIHLGQHQDRRDARLHHHRQITFQTLWAEICIARRDDQRGIDVCRDQLQRPQGIDAFDHTAPHQHIQQRAGLGINNDPIANGGPRFFVATKPAPAHRYAICGQAAVRRNAQSGPLNANHSRNKTRRQRIRRVAKLGHLGLEMVIPAERLELLRIHVEQGLTGLRHATGLLCGCANIKNPSRDWGGLEKPHPRIQASAKAP